jgi:hypothetical protein
MIVKLKCKVCKKHKVEHRLPQRRDGKAICNECYARELIRLRNE